MAESPFLKYQDKNRDGLIDACDVSEIVPTDNCPPCRRNPNAITPNWKKQDTQEPWFNEKYCIMQCTVTTSVTSLLGTEEDDPGADNRTSRIVRLFDDHVNIAIESLFDNFNKLSTDETFEAIRPHVQYTKYDLDPRFGETVKLLYSIPVDDFALIAEAIPPEEEEEDEDTSPITVTYDTKEVFPKLMKLRKAMYLYSRYYRVFTGIEGGNLFFEDGTVFTHNKFDRYGDPGFFVGSSRMADVLKDLDNWLNNRGFNLYLGGVGDFKYLFSEKNVVKFTMEFTPEYELKKLKIFTVGCREKPLVYGTKANLRALKSKDSFKDPTAMAYFAKLNEIDTFLSARVARPWLEFVQEFTYPKVSTQEQYPTPELDGSNMETAMSCVGDALLEEGKQLGQDIMDDIFSIGDAVAYAFHKNVCKRSLGAINTELEQMGIVYKKDKDGKSTGKRDYSKIKDPKTGEEKSIAAMATSQAFEELENSDQVFVQMCATLLASSLPLGTSSDEIMRSLWRDGLGRLKLCGLMDLMVDAIQCLFKGLSLEQALKAALKSALKALPLNNWGDLFVGLPPNKQAELDALVKKKLSQPPAPSDQRLDDATRGDDNLSFMGTIEFKKPWEDEELLERELATKSYGNYDNEVRQASLNDHRVQRNQRTLAQKYDDAHKSLGEGGNFGIEPDTVMDAYIIALIEVYANDLLSLVDEMNKFPGAQIIAKIISVFDCPSPPVFDPNFADFLNSIDLPFCRSINEIQLPMLQNPFGWLANWADILEKLYEALREAIQRVLLSILFRILVKICQLLGDAICKALGVVGDLAASLPDLVAGRDTISNVIKDSICGPGASDEQVDATIAEMFEKFGVGGAALSNTERIKQFCEDLSSATTAREVVEAFDGQPSQAFLDVGHTILQNQYPEFADALPSRQDLADLFANMGKLVPVNVRASMKDFLVTIPIDDDLPANPSLCATPEDREAFMERRCMLLEGRASPEDCEYMFQNLENELLEDLEELTDLTEGGVANAVAAALPPLVSTPGCDDGIIPFETEIDSSINNSLVDGQLQQLQIAYSKDMLGNGGLFAGNNDWGLINMILSDTHGRALSTHRRMVVNREKYVDFVSSQELDNDLGALLPSGNKNSNMDGVPVAKQEGQFPKYVAEWLWQQMTALSTTAKFESDNSEGNIQKARKFYKSFEDLGFINMFNAIDVNLLSLPDFGYDSRFSTDMGRNEVVVKKGPRKKEPDVKLEFRDNNENLDKKTPFDFGFSVKMWTSDITSIGDPGGVKQFVNRFDDNARIMIEHWTCERVKPEDEEDSDSSTRSPAAAYNKFCRERRYEFLSVDDTLSDIDLSNYQNYSETQNKLTTYIPQVNMLADLVGLIPNENLKRNHDSIMTMMLQDIMSKVVGGADSKSGPSDIAWQYGAAIDDLREEDLEYVVKGGTTESPGGTLYSEAEVTDYDDDGNPSGTRSIENDDMILGISYMKYRENQGDSRKNRVFFLDPSTYGGTHIRPKIYIKPVENQGWLGMVDVMFPEAGPCKPQLTDLIDIKGIAAESAASYNTMPEDQRLKGDPDCVVEKPYNRILNRESKSGIQALITAACRIYCSVHYVKALATFTTFNTAVKENYSSIFSAYIVEIMEKDFRDAQNNFWEFFNPFKDDEFWYAFLEQSVQTYARLVDEGKIIPPAPVIQAMVRINDAQENYKYPTKKSLQRAREIDRAQEWPAQTLKGWRYEKNLDAVQATEEDAKLILKEFVTIELNKMAEKFNNNAKHVGLTPKYNDLLLYMLKEYTNGASTIDMDKEIVEEVSDIGEIEGEDEALYTHGGELSLPDGTPYVGYFHRHQDEDGNDIFMVGETHSSAEHDELTVYANKVTIPIGDITPWSGVPSPTSESTPFAIRKYISINGTRYAPDEAVSIIKENDNEKNISEVYPGTLKHLLDTDIAHNTGGEPKVVGLTGELGVRYGLVFYISIGTEIYEITSVELDALDLKINQMPTLEGNSKLLYCLINNLRDDERFKILMRYVFPANKLTSLIAIYNDQGLLPSIAQITVSKGDANKKDASKKPGIRAVLDEESGEVLEYDWTMGWEHKNDRDTKWTWGYRTWDEWDRVDLLSNSKVRIKKLFKPMYNARDFEESVKNLTKTKDGGSLMIQNLKAAISLPPGAGLMSWWQRGRLLKSSPTNAKGKICSKSDE